MYTDKRKTVIIRKEYQKLDLPGNFKDKKLAKLFPNSLEPKPRIFKSDDSYLRHYQQRIDSYSIGFQFLVNAQDDSVLSNDTKDKMLHFNKKIKIAEENKKDLLVAIESSISNSLQILFFIALGYPVKDLPKWYSELSKPMQEAYKKAIKNVFENGKLSDPNNGESSAQEVREQLSRGLCQVALDQYISTLSVVIAKEFNISEHQAVELLDKAEQYAVTDEGRAALVSVSQRGKYTLVQVEQPLQALSDRLLDNYFDVINPKVEYSQKPDWYLAMDLREQQLLRYLLRDIAISLHDMNSKENVDKELIKEEIKKKIKEQLSTLPSKLRTIPGAPNLSRTHLYIYEGNELKRHTQRLRSSMISSRDVLKQSQKIRDFHTIENLKHIIEQQVAIQVKKMAESLGLTVQQLVDSDDFSLPILVQTLITPSLLMEKFGGKPDRMLHDDKIRAIEAIMQQMQQDQSPYQLKVDGVVIPHKNIAIYATNHALNTQRFKISATAKTAPVSSGQIENSSIDFLQMAKNRIAIVKLAVENKKLKLKHAQEEIKINKLKELKISNTEVENQIYSSCNSACREIDNKEAEFKNEFEKKLNINLLKKAIDKYDAWLKKGVMRFTDKYDRELILSSLEQVIVELCGGVAYGSCVSGKDRKGLETLHTNAMWIFIQENDQIPDLENSEEDRKAFAAIFAELFVTRHQQENAGQNAPGANGAKTPDFYLPVYIKDAIRKLRKKDGQFIDGQRILDESDDLATNNEADQIVTLLKDKNVCDGVKRDYANYKHQGLYQQKEGNKEKKFEVNKQFLESGEYEDRLNNSVESESQSEKNYTAYDCINLLKDILGYKDFWSGTAILRITKTFEWEFGEATGIKEIRKQLTNLPDNSSETEIKAKFDAIIGIVEQRGTLAKRRHRVDLLYKYVKLAATDLNGACNYLTAFKSLIQEQLNPKKPEKKLSLEEIQPSEAKEKNVSSNKKETAAHYETSVKSFIHQQHDHYLRTYGISHETVKRNNEETIKNLEQEFN